MIIENALEKLAKLIRDGRSVEQIKRGEFAHVHDVKRDLMNQIEHQVPVRIRRILRSMIIDLKFSDKTKNRAFILVNEVCPRHWKNRKVHLRWGIVQARRGQR